MVQKFVDQDLIEGEKLELQIKVLASKPRTVTWYRDDEVIEADERCKLLSDDDIFLLRVDPVEIDDEAIYKCVVKNQVGQDQCEAQILVEGIVATCHTFYSNCVPFSGAIVEQSIDHERDSTCNAMHRENLRSLGTNKSNKAERFDLLDMTVSVIIVFSFPYEE